MLIPELERAGFYRLREDKNILIIKEQSVDKLSATPLYDIVNR